MDNPRPLSSWKEIAAYLGCDERTCLRWEKRFGLPVHRLANDLRKSHVFAYQDELDQWLTKHKRLPSGPPKEPGASLPRSKFKLRGPWLVLIPLILLGALAVILLGWPPWRPQPQPKDFRIEGSRLTILDGEGRRLWIHETGISDLCGDAYYRDRFQTRKMIAGGLRTTPLILIRDINADGRVEVLFSVQTQSNFERGSVICFDGRGRRLWTFDAGRDRVFGSKRYPPQYGVQSVDFLAEGASDRGLILVIGYQHPEFPTYAAFLSPRGEIKGEYWNAGRLSDYELIDLENDGKSELVLVGTNNEYLKGCLIVLDPLNAWGSSPQTGEYRSPDLPPGTEKYYLLFPRTEVDMLEDVREAMDFIKSIGSGRFIVRALMSSLFFRFNRDLGLDAVIDSDTFWRKYQKYQDLGRIPAGVQDPESFRRTLAKGLLYWDGSRWVTRMMPNKRNVSSATSAAAK